MQKSIPRRAVEAAGWLIVLYLCYRVFGDIVTRTADMFSVLSDGSFVEPDPDSFQGRYNVHPYWTLLHVVPAALFATLGPLQFTGAVRKRLPTFHRISGRIYIISTLLLGVGALGITLVFPMWGLLPMKTVSLLSGAFLIVAVSKAYVHARRREFHIHREWMIRGFAIGLGVSTFRVINDWLFANTTMSFDEVWNATGWMSFSINLLVAEIWIDYTRPWALFARARAGAAGG